MVVEQKAVEMTVSWGGDRLGPGPQVHPTRMAGREIGVRRLHECWMGVDNVPRALSSSSLVAIMYSRYLICER